METTPGAGPSCPDLDTSAGCDAPDIQAGYYWLDRKAAERERSFQQQQRQQTDDRRDLRLERRLDAERRMEPDRPGWSGR